MAKGTVTISGTAEAQAITGNTTITGILRVLEGSVFSTSFLSAWALE
jgi:hypothetical protein